MHAPNRRSAEDRHRRRRARRAQARQRPQARVGRGGLCRRHPRAAGDAADLHRHERAGACRGEEARRVEGAHRAGRRHRADGQGSPRRQRREPVRRRRSHVRRRPGANTTASPCSPSPPTPWRRPAPPRGWPSSSTRTGLRSSRSTRPWRRNPSSSRPTRCSAAMPRPPSPRAPHVIEGRMYIGGQEHFYLEGQVALRRAGRGRRRDGPLLLAASERDPAQGRARAGRAEPRRHGRDAPHGRRLRRQGEPGQSAGCRRGAGRQADRPSRQVLLRPRRRHDHHRQAARLPHRLSRRLRRGRAHPRHRVRAGDPLRHVDRPLLRHRRPRHVPRRQHLLSAGRAHHLLPLQDAHPVQHRLPRLRRPAGHGGDGAGDRRDRAYARARSAGGAPRQLLRPHGRQAGEPAQRHALLPDHRGLRDPGDRRRVGGELRTTAGGARRSAPGTRRARS